MTARQHGAMEYSEPPTDLNAVRRYRLGCLREEMARRDVPAILLFDPLNSRYAIDATNMQLWCTHYETRCVFVALEGPVVLFDYADQPHLVEGLPLIDEVRVMPAFYYFAAGPSAEAMARRFGDEIADLVHRHGGGKRLGIDRLSHLGCDAIRSHGIELLDAQPVTEHARAIKSAGEIALMRRAIDVAEEGCRAMRDALRPGITENALWAKLHETNIRLGGEWIETRLMTSGPRTNPWMQECSMRAIEAGDLVAFDTDLIGPYGYCADISRTWLCGDGKPSDEQRRLYAAAYAQIEHNIGVMKPGMSFREVAEKGWPIPVEFMAGRYSCLAHGAGLADEWPSIAHREDFALYGYDGIIEPGMVLCVESYIGAERGREGVKLEEQVLVTETVIERLSTLPFETGWL